MTAAPTSASAPAPLPGSNAAGEAGADPVSTESGAWFARLQAAFAPRVVGGRTMPSPWLILAAAIGASLLLVVATTSWSAATDEQAYWRAAVRFATGGSMYDASALPGDASYGYWYPPPLAQVLAPLTGLLSADAFSVAWTVLLLGCLWWLGGRNPLVALALIAFVPVAVELRVRNVHLVLAVLTVLALRRSSLLWIAGAAIKVAPVLGIVYLAAARRWREAFLVGGVGAAVLALSFLLARDAWRDFFAIVGPQAGPSGASIVPLPFAVRFAGGAALALLGGQLAFKGRVRLAELVLLLGLVLANPTLWVTALSMLVALVPLWRSPPERRAGAAPVRGTAAA
jgi:Glycosyltransferase family 87